MSRGPTITARQVGLAGETAAAAHLESIGFRILAVDWRVRAGQLDIVAVDGETLVAVEVKARRGLGFGLPAEAIDRRKQARLRMLLETYRAASGRWEQRCRIDVVSLLLDRRLEVVRCDHVRGAVEEP